MKRGASWKDGLPFDAARFPDASDAGLQKRRRLMSVGFCGASAGMVMEGFTGVGSRNASDRDWNPIVALSLHQKATARLKDVI